MQLDVFVPDLKLALEYHGRQHYEDVYAFGAQEDTSYRDSQKREACRQNGITLVEVPYWWDFDRESLAATIHARRPDLLQGEEGDVIPSAPPPSGSANGSDFAPLTLKASLPGWRSPRTGTSARR